LSYGQGAKNVGGLMVRKTGKTNKKKIISSAVSARTSLLYYVTICNVIRGLIKFPHCVV
jgi:hypothetical protein